MSKIKIYLFVLVATIIAYTGSIKYGFSQDDWFHLTISRANNIKEFLNFFNPSSVTWIFFRPLSTQLPYWLGSTIFPLSTAPHFMHILMLLIHTFNAYLVVLIGRKYLKGNVSILLGMIYAISSIHYLSLFYIGAIQQLISTLFSLLAIYVFTKRPRGSQLTLLVITGCALLSKELAIRLPLILFVLSYIEEGHIIPAIKAVVGPIIVTLVYFLIRFVFSSGAALEYSVVLSTATTFATGMWYGLFTLGFPEEILRYGLSGGQINFVGFLSINPAARLPIFISASLLLVYVFYQLYLTIKVKKDWHWLIFPCLAVLSILPIIFLPTHRYPHYLDLSLLFLGIWLLRNITKINLKVVVAAMIIGIGMFASIRLETSTHWTVKRALISEQVEAKLIEGGLCQNVSSIVFEGSAPGPLEVSYAMSDMNGPRIICNNPSLQVYYQGVSAGDIPHDAHIISTEGIQGL